MVGGVGQSLEAGVRLCDRYEIRRTLGRGAMGVVYEAFDRVRGARVALKAMRRLSATDLYRFKQEFRALADVSHPNLAALHELETDGDRTFFTMEVVEGVDFLTFVTDRPGSRAELATSVAPQEGAAPEGASAGAAEAPTRATPRPRVETASDVHRLRQALAQLVDGVAALHASGKLHRDLKPTNVFVTPEGRVVILDFGLVAGLGREGTQTVADSIVGTPEYMSPEQAASGKLTEASDWYSVGVMLYEALTGELPFVGPPLTILTNKQELAPSAPHEVAAGVSEDLSALCVELLQREPARRPTAAEIRQRVGLPSADRASLPEADPRGQPSVGGAFVGRARHMAALGSSFETARAGRAVVAYVHGRSGMGKSLLGQRFLDSLTQRRPDAVVLSARCYERESVPYKALDSIVDALSEHLHRLPHAEVDAILPVEIRALTRLFPVLNRVAAVAAAAPHHREIADLQELRRRAAMALRELLARMAMRRPLVLWIDDLQWADVDSAALIEEALRPPDPPPLLLIASYRSEDAASVFVTALRRVHGAGRGAAECCEIEVGTLEPAEATELASALLRDELEAPVHAAAIAAEARGSPFFVDALVQHLRAGRAMESPVAGTPRLEEVLHERVSALPDDARRLLEVVAVAGKPLERVTAVAAAQLDGQSEIAALALLRAGKLVRSQRGRDRHTIATYHDRIRETVVARLDPASRARIHLRLAQALVADGSADLEALVVHFGEGGDRAKEAEAAAVAAAKAVEALAFDRAAALWRRALELPGLSVEVSQDLRSKLAEALTNDGRDAEAAELRLESAREAGRLEALDLRRRASEQFLLSGHFDRGYALLRAVLADVGERFPTSPLAVVFWVLVSRLRLRLRGLSFREGQPAALDRLALVRIDSVGSAGAGFAMTDNIRGAYFQTKNLLLALDAGDARRIARALALEVCFTSASGSPKRARTFELLDSAKRLAARVGTPDALALADLASGYASYMNGEWRDAKAAFVAAEERFRDKCIDVNWLLSSTRTMLYRTLVLRGELGELATRIPPVLRTAEERGDEYGVLNFRAIPVTMLLLAKDEPASALENLEALSEKLPRGVFHVQHYYVLMAALDLDIYAGEPRRGLERLRAVASAMRRSLLLRVETVRLLTLDQRARCAIAAAAGSSGASRADLAASADSDATTIAKVDSAWARALALTLRAGGRALAGDRAGAIAELACAEDASTASDMLLRAAAARRRRGQILGGDEGAALVGDAEAAMRQLGVRNAEAMTRLYAPALELLLSPSPKPGASIAQ
jgi:serine/threonine protein kinase